MLAHPHLCAPEHSISLTNNKRLATKLRGYNGSSWS